MLVIIQCLVVLISLLSLGLQAKSHPGLGVSWWIPALLLKHPHRNELRAVTGLIPGGTGWNVKMCSMRARGDDHFVPSGLEGVNKSINHNFCCQLEAVLLNLEKQEEEDSDQSLISGSQVFQRLCVAGWAFCGAELSWKCRNTQVVLPGVTTSSCSGRRGDRAVFIHLFPSVGSFE